MGVQQGSDSEIYEALQGDLIRYATALVGPSAAADVVSSVVVRVLSSGSLSDLEAPRPYLFRAVLNESINSRRRAHREVAGPVAETVDDHPNLHPEVMAAVMGLPAQQRAATYLVYWAGHTIAETAELMGLGRGTVKRYLSLARASLKGALHAHSG